MFATSCTLHDVRYIALQACEMQGKVRVINDGDDADAAGGREKEQFGGNAVIAC